MGKTMFLCLLWASLLPALPAPASALPQEKPGGAASMDALLQDARAVIAKVEAEKAYDRLAAVEAEWAGKIAKYLEAHPADPDLGRGACFLVMLEGGAAEGGAKIRALYDRIKEPGAAAPWFEGFLRRVFYQLHGKDPGILLEILGDAEKHVKRPAAKAAILYYRAFTLAETGKEKEARPILERITKEFPGTPFAAPARGHLQEMDHLRPGMAVPAFKLPGLAGGEVSLEALKGKIVVLFFWTARCPLLAERAAALKDLAARHTPDPFAMLGICLDSGPDREAAKKKAVELGMTWPNGFDGKGLEGPLARAYGTTLLPRTFLIDANGKILSTDLFLQGNAGFLVNDAVTKRKAEIQKAEAAKKKAEAAKAKAAAPPKKPPAKK